RPALDLDHPLQRIGKTYARVDPEKVVGVVETDLPDELGGFDPADPTSRAIAGHVVQFLLDETAAGRIPPEFLPLQSGVGHIANAVMAGPGGEPRGPPLPIVTQGAHPPPAAATPRRRPPPASTPA